MLLYCIGLVYANIVADKRDDLLNTSFEPAISALACKTEPVQIISDLCKHHQVSEVDALEIKAHRWKDLLKKYFNDNLLKGNASTFLGLLSAQNYEYNISSLKNNMRHEGTPDNA